MTDMIKRFTSILLSLALAVCAVPIACAQPADDGWLIYCENIDENTFAAIIVAPAKYTHLSDNPLIETIHTADRIETGVSTPETEQIRFSFCGNTETHWKMTVTCPIVDEGFPEYYYKFTVLPGSLLDDAGKGNERVFFEDEVDYLSAQGYAEIDVYSALLLRDYSRDDDTVAVGDTLRVDYSGLYPVDIFVNGEKTASFPGGEMQRYTCSITETGSLSVVVRQGDEQIETRSMTIISSKEMYERNLRDGLITDEDIPDTEDLVDVGVPAGSPFIFTAKIIALFNAIVIFFQRLFSFTRIEG